jgi:uncharacterized protein (DUF1800 family)
MPIDAYTANLLLSRLTYGPTYTSRAELTAQGLGPWLQGQFAGREETHHLISGKTVFLSNQLDIRSTLLHQNYRRRHERVSQETAGLTLLRRLYSVNQVTESLVEFISDYVPVPLFSDADWARMDYDKTIRAGISGTYPDLLVSLSLHPAMLFYLNGQTNTVKSPNENFGRELLELFTVTPNDRYTETDVQSVAKLLTGISYSMVEYRTVARPENHYFGPISVKGFSHSNSSTGDSDVILSRARQLIVHLAKLPATAKAFSLRMARRYLSDKPAADILRAMEETYLETGGSIPKTMQTMVLHPRFLSTPAEKVKRPAEHFGSTVRALGLEPSSKLLENKGTSWGVESDALNPLVGVLNRQGHSPFDWETPDGYPDFATAWSTFGGQIQRWNFSARVSQGGLTNLFSQPTYQTQFLSYKDLPELVSSISQSLLAQPLRGEDRDQMVKLLQNSDFRNLPDATRRSRAVSMATALVMATEEWNSR